MNFCAGAEVNDMQSARTISRVWEGTPNKFPRGAKPQNCGFWHRGRNLLSVTANFPHFRSPLFPGLYKCFFQISLCLLLVHREPLLQSISPFLLLLILQRVFLPAFAKMTPGAVVSTGAGESLSLCSLLRVNAPNAKHQGRKNSPHLLLQPAGVKMAGSGARQQKKQ